MIDAVCCFVLALLGAADALKNPNTTLLGSWPMIHAHDAATTYLETGIVDEWAKTQQDGGVASLFECGARALDWRGPDSRCVQRACWCSFSRCWCS